MSLRDHPLDEQPALPEQFAEVEHFGYGHRFQGRAGRAVGRNGIEFEVLIGPRANRPPGEDLDLSDHVAALAATLASAITYLTQKCRTAFFRRFGLHREGRSIIGA
jgi:hypothetical protein